VVRDDRRTDQHTLTIKFPELKTPPELSRLPNSHTLNLQTVKMPQEVSDIKQFIEICRRQDASCEFRRTDLCSETPLDVEERGHRLPIARCANNVYSGTHKEEQGKPSQVQGPMQEIPLHFGLEGFGKGREAQAKLTTQYVALHPNISEERN
jgi:hypothetical protein